MLSYSDKQRAKDGTFTLSDAPFQETWTRAATEHISSNYNSEGEPLGFKIWAFPTSLAVTEGILVSFFSSAYWYA